jgi:ligand-binding sensor domain-containing protein
VINKKKTLCLAAFLLFSICVANISADTADNSGVPLTTYVHNVWRTADGLPEEAVQAVAQTPDGYLWLGTQEGLARFDGVRFVVYDSRSTPEIADSKITKLQVSRDGSLWIGTGLGSLIRFKEEKFTSYPELNRYGMTSIGAIFEDHRGNLWIGRRGKGLVCLRDGRLTLYTTKEGLADNAVSAITEDTNGDLWIGTDKGLSSFREGRFFNYGTKDGMSNNAITSLAVDNEGGLWIATKGGGLNRYDHGRFTVLRKKDGLPSDSLTTIAQGRGGSLWIGTDEGLSRLREGEFENYSTKQGLSQNVVDAIFEDAEENIWIGTHGGGLNRLRRGKFATYGTSEGLQGSFVRSVLEDHRGSIWAGTLGNGLSRFSKGKFTTYTTQTGLSDNNVGPLYEGRDGMLWVGTRAGVDRMMDGKIVGHTRNRDLPERFEGRPQSAPYFYVRAISETGDGAMWFGTDGGGLVRYDKGQYVQYGSKNGLLGDYIHTLMADREGGLWVATDQGVSYLHDGKVISYDSHQGLNRSVFCFYEDNDGTIWMGTDGGGLRRLKNGKLTMVTTKDGLFDGVYQILEDENGNLWMSSDKGVSRVGEKELNDFADGLIREVTTISYGVADGMKSRECDGGLSPAGWKARDGKLWFATVEGIAVVDPGNFL